MGKGVPLWKDLLYAVLIVAGVLGTLTIYTSVWPPMVVVESGSMMHPDDRVGYGRIGTIDPGDMVLVKAIDGRDDVETFGDDGRTRYGLSGDVLVYYANNNRARTPIIHRAMAYVEVSGPQSDRTYTLMWEGERRTFGNEGLYIPSLGFDESHGFTRSAGYRPPVSGFITKGDNPATNRAADQAMGLSTIVEPGWVQGKARGELPWFGLIKLAVTPCDSPPCNQRSAPLAWPQIGYAAAPKDLWVMLAVALGAVIFLPIGYDLAKARYLESRGERPPPPPPERSPVASADAPPEAPAPDEPPPGERPAGGA